jgi:DedD protein
VVPAPPVLPPADAGIEPAPAAVPAPEPARVAPAASAAPRAAAPVASAPLRAAAPAASVAVGDAASAARPSRFVVQVGAFSDASALREVRQKVEKLGYKTYTQEVVVDGSKRTRVRIGPYENRDEAEAAAASLKRADLKPAVVRL